MGEVQTTGIPQMQMPSEAPATEYKLLRLYGGAVVVSVPEKFFDTSDLRQIPDHQEVYLLRDGDTSIVLEMMELVDKPDHSALKHHFYDMTETDEQRLVRPLEIKPTKVTSMGDKYPAYIARALVPNRPKRNTGDQNDNKEENEQTFIILVMIRLKDYGTDFLISINTPNVKPDAIPTEQSLEFMATSEKGDMVAFAEQTMRKVLETVEIRRWDLFADDTDSEEEEEEKPSEGEKEIEEKEEKN